MKTESTKYKIRMTRYYYGPRKVRTWLGESFDSKSEAQDWIDKFDSTVYSQDHGEYGRPSFRIYKDL